MPPKGTKRARVEKATATVADAEPSKANLKAKGGAAARAAAAAVASAGSAFARAVERYKLLPAAPKTKQDDAVWARYIEFRGAAGHARDWLGRQTLSTAPPPPATLRDKAAAEAPGPDDFANDEEALDRAGVRDRVKGVLEAMPKLNDKDVALLLRSTLVVQAGADWADGDDVRGLEVRARVFSVDGPNVVDVLHAYHRRTRWDSIELFADVKVAIHTPAADAPDARRGYLQELWKVSMGGGRRCREVRDFDLSAGDIAEIRDALFTGRKLSAKLSDYDLMTWLLAAAGYSEGGGAYGFEVWPRGRA